MRDRELEHCTAAHAGPDGGDLAELQFTDQVRDVVGVGADRVGALRLVALAVSTQVDRHDTMPFRESLGLWREERPVARPAMDEDERGGSRFRALRTRSSLRRGSS